MLPRTRRGKTVVFAVCAAAVLGTAVAVRQLGGRVDAGRGQHAVDVASLAASASFAGSRACQSCHAAEYESWQRSQHNRAMQLATPGTVLGDFSGATFTYGDVTSTFTRRGDTYVVRTDAADGSLQDFEIEYTFGVDPLQQYLVEFPDGRLQALSIAWDSRPREAGGQRWMHLYPGDRIDHTDELHWTGRQQNWNFQCADCHSTNVRKAYDASTDRFRTTWSEINVSCEACHGPGSEHVRWAEAPGWLRSWWWRSNGLTAQLTERSGITWSIEPASGQPVRSAPRATDREIETCAVCHARRSQIAEGHVAGAPLHDAYVPALLESGLYFPDGQQRDEVYTYGSFLQSRMYAAGVTCADCHDPHTQNLRLEGNALCGQCHTANRYDTPAHHRHQPDSAGAACVSCHMPARTYMLIDPRRDHSFRVPRPDRSVSLGVPNACNDCHGDRTAAWAAQQVRDWLGRDPQGFQTFAEAFHADEDGRRGAPQLLQEVADAAGQTPIVRASALLRLGRQMQAPPVSTVQAGLDAPDSSVRRAALTALGVFPPNLGVSLGVPLLEDVARSVRIEAAWQLAPMAAAFTGGSDRDTFARAVDEFVAAQRLVADRPEGRVTLGELFARLGRTSEAVDEYRAAIRLGPTFPPAYVGLAELYRRSGDEQQAEETLRAGLAKAPETAGLHHALGLSLARSRRVDEAIASLGRGAALAPEEARFAYAYAVGLHSAGRVEEAIAVLEQARARHPTDRDLLFALAAFHRDAGRIDAAVAAATELREHYPGDPDALALLQQLQSRR